MGTIGFINNNDFVCRPETFIASLPTGISSKKELFNRLGQEMKLPQYFGFNWDALSDCLRDFHWIMGKDIFLIHSDLPSLNHEDIKTYLQILSGAVQDWRKDETHNLVVTFPKEIEEQVKGYLLE